MANAHSERGEILARRLACSQRAIEAVAVSSIGIVVHASVIGVNLGPLAQVVVVAQGELGGRAISYVFLAVGTANVHVEFRSTQVVGAS